MNKRFMKLILGGTLAVVVTLIVVGTASARIYSSGSASSTSSLLGYPRGVVGAPGLPSVDSTPAPQHVQKSQATAGYSAFPEVVRTMNLGNAAHTSTSSSSFDWSNAGIGVGIGIGVLCAIGLFFVSIRRSKATPAAA